MKLCLECDALFDAASTYMETHGLDTPPFETKIGCPVCGGNFVEALQCDMCGQWITGEYIKIGYDTVVCDNCYSVRHVEDDV